MYRILILLSLMHVVVPHRDCTRHYCHRNHHHQDSRLRHRDRTFDHLARQVINLDKKTRELCIENSNNRTIEDYGGNEYKLTVSLPEYKEEEITVKLKYRALYINAEKEVESETKVYFEVRVIPVVADLTHASWDFIDGKLEISFPYKDKQKDTATCEFAIDDEVKSVRKYSPDLDIRMPTESSVAPSGTKEDSKENQVKTD